MSHAAENLPPEKKCNKSLFLRKALNFVRAQKYGPAD